ncbi:hypothetical protein ACFL59_06310 [Planctomycetota bacterium]
MTVKPTLGEEEMAAFEPEAKIGLLATRNPAGLPHVTLITSIQAKSPGELMWGQFCEGLSKEHVRADDRCGFLVMNAERNIWRGKARWTHAASEGEDYVLFNQKPMFRYNAYFGIHTVHYMELEELLPKERVFLPSVLAGTIVTAVARHFCRTTFTEPILKAWAEAHLRKVETLKYLAFVAKDGYPEIVPVVPCQPADSRRLVFAPTGNRKALAALSKGQSVALFALNLEMESVLVRGTFAGYMRAFGLRAGMIDVDWVYNSMPPKQGPVYPPRPLHAVTAF